MLVKRRPFNPLDAILVTLLLCAAGFDCLPDQCPARLQLELGGLCPSSCFRYDQESGQWVTNYLVQGLLTTVRLSLWSSILALLLGLVWPWPAPVGSFTAGWWRGLHRVDAQPAAAGHYFPLLFFPGRSADSAAASGHPGNADLALRKQLLLLVLAPPEQLSAFFSALITLAVFESAYVAEILRAGIESIGRPQRDAAAALGLTHSQSLRHVVLPQAIRRVLPPLAGQMISLIKDSAIVSVISIQELTYQGTQLMASTYLTIEVWLTVAALYFLLTFPCSLLVDYMERRLIPAASIKIGRLELR